MRVTFERWLARPSTWSFLRRVIQSETGKPTWTRHATRHQHTNTHQSNVTNDKGKETNEEVEGGEQAEKSRSSLRDSRYIYHGERLINSRRAMYMSLRSGAVVLPPDIDTPSVSWEMHFQADVDSPQLVGKLQVDQPENAGNMALWCEILNRRHRLHGIRGVKEVWNGMRRRNVDLPTEGAEAELLWSVFIHATILTPEESARLRADDRLTTDDVCDYALDLKTRTGRSHALLYEILVGHWLKVQLTIAHKWHKYLVDSGLAHLDSFLKLVDTLMTVASPSSAFRMFFRATYRASDRRDIYETVMSSALRHEVAQSTLLSYHKLFVDCGDLPREPFASDPRILKLFKLQEETQPGQRGYQNAVNTKPGKMLDRQGMYAGVNREFMNTIVGEVYDIKPKEFSDEFCARMFATRAFSIQWVIKGLALFSVDKLGPLAMREMAIRAGTPKDFCKELEHLESASISIGDSVFSRLLVKVAKADNYTLWQALMESDQHPEAYDDVWTQNALLASHLAQKQWVRAHLGLLTASLSGEHASTRAWNSLVQNCMLDRDYEATADTLESMQSQGIILTHYTLHVMRWHVLPQRDASKRAQTGEGPMNFEPTIFVAKAYIYAAEKGILARHTQWIEILKRLGMNHQWKPFERVVLSLLNHFDLQRGDSLWLEGDARRNERLEAVFTPNMRKALFIWGFRSASIRNQLCGPKYIPKDKLTSLVSPPSVEKWAQGLPLLQRLRDIGFEFPIDDVRVVFVQRMWILFGPAYSTRPINHEARRNNRFSLAHYIKHANEVWPGLIDWVEPELLETENDVRLLPAFFGDFQRVNLKRREIAGVQAWSKALASGAEYIVEPKKTRDKEAAWMRSPLRMPYRPMEALDSEEAALPSVMTTDGPVKLGKVKFKKRGKSASTISNEAKDTLEAQDYDR